MFYSQTYLARKGPLGTVWCAAHLQHKLKKSHYASTDIPHTVAQIIYPDVPIALRMYGHLLLGVVRIYSKKVDYLHHDCNLLWGSLRNAFRASHLDANVNLPDHATQASFNAVTLPETFALDALDLDHLSLLHGSPDDHLLTQDEITLKDQHQANTELYVRITFDDDINPDTSNPAGSLQHDAETMLIDSPRVPDSSNLAGSLHRDAEMVLIDSPRVPESGPNQVEESPEKMRDRDDNEFFLSSPVLRPHKSPTGEPNLPPLGDTTERVMDTPHSLHTSTPQMQPRTSPQGSGPSSPRLDGPHVEHEPFEAPRSSELELRPSPSPQRPQPQRRQRKRKQTFDETLVLKNMFYKKALNDTSDLVKKRKKLPSSALEMRSFINNKKKEQVFFDPLISGMCTSLQNLSSKDLTAFNRNLPVSESVQLESRAAESPEHGPKFNEETEHLRSPDRDPGHNIGHVFSPHQSFFGDAAIHTSPRIPSTVTEPRFVSPFDTQTDTGIFTRNIDVDTDVDMDTPIMNVGGTTDNLGTGLSDIPEWRNSMEPNDLLFLEQDNNSPPDSQSGQGRDTMSVRTRAVAQYLKNHSPLSKVSDGSDDLSLNAILQGRSRKLSARMFYETLVLKDCGLIDVKQEEPYADITLKLTPGISMAKL